jgi:hypothetical protein
MAARFFEGGFCSAIVSHARMNEIQSHGRRDHATPAIFVSLKHFDSQTNLIFWMGMGGPGFPFARRKSILLGKQIALSCCFEFQFIRPSFALICAVVCRSQQGKSIYDLHRKVAR